jgi:hypothetical protein
MEKIVFFIIKKRQKICFFGENLRNDYLRANRQGESSNGLANFYVLR